MGYYYCMPKCETCYSFAFLSLEKNDLQFEICNLILAMDQICSNYARNISKIRYKYLAKTLRIYNQVKVFHLIVFSTLVAQVQVQTINGQLKVEMEETRSLIFFIKPTRLNCWVLL